MHMPFSVESYIKKAKKSGYTVTQIKQALSAASLWNKVINEGKPFPKMFEHYLEMARDGNLPSQTKKESTGDMKVIYQQYKGRLI